MKIKNQKKILIILMISLILLSSLVLADIINNPLKDKKTINSVSYTPSTETICNGNVCTKTLYSGTRFVEEDNKWKKVEDAKSLKNSNIKCVVNSDGENIAECLDYNYTSITLSLEKTKSGISQIKVLEKNENNSFNIKSSEDYNFKNSLLSLVKDKKEVVVQANYGDIIHFGENSTTIQLQDNETDNLMDTYVRSDTGDTNYGSLSAVAIKDRAAGIYRSYFMFNISSVPPSQIIEDAKLCLNMFNNGLTGDTSAYHIIDNGMNEQNETTIIWNNQACGINFDDSVKCNLTSEDTQACDSTGWWCWDITNGVIKEYSESDVNVSIALKSDLESNNYGSDQYYSKEYATTSLRPYLNITYTEENPTETIPTISINSKLLFSGNGRFSFYG